MTFRFALIFALLVLPLHIALAETAEEILQRSAQAITEARGFNGRAWGQVSLYSPVGVHGPRQESYAAYHILHRSPDDWMSVGMRQHSMGGRPQQSANQDVQMYAYRLASGEEQRGLLKPDGQKQVIEVPNRSPTRVPVLGDLGQSLDTDPFLAVLEYWSRGSGDAFDWPLTNLSLRTDEHMDDGRTWHVVGHDSRKRETHLWISKNDLTLLRSVMVTRMGAQVRSISEWCYDQRLSLDGLRGDAFTSPVRLPFSYPLSTMSMGLTDGGILLTDYSKPVVSEKPAEPAESEVQSAKPAVVAEQKLSPEQMAAIVLIESGDGQASGFMTKLRGVNFIVTNLHVLGPDPQLILRGLDGSVLQQQGVFGAVGRDVAIIRVGEISNELPITENILADVKIGDEVVVVGNQRGGRVATQVVGKVLGIGPGRVEVDAQFEPGNSGSPVVHVKSGKVIGVATYSEKRYVDKEGEAARSRSEADKVEQRWFAYRLDGITQWEAIDFARWRAQYKQIEEFNEDTESLFEITQVNLESGKTSPRLRPYIEAFEEKAARYGRGSVGLASEAQNFMGNIRGRSRSGIREMEKGEFYDYFRTSLYWRTSIPQQLEYRNWVVERVERMNSNINSWHSKLRN